MKKLTVLFSVLLCISGLLTGCSKESVYQPSEVENVSISIDDISPTGATVTIKDTNTEAHVYGELYIIEKETFGKWYEMKPIISNYAFNGSGYLPNEKGEIEFKVDWEWLYGELPSGNYRLLKQVDQKYISVEFNV